MGYRSPPKALALGIDAGQLDQLVFGDAQFFQFPGRGFQPFLGHRQDRRTVFNAQDFYHPAVVGGDPGGFVIVVPSRRNDLAHREIKEIIHVTRQRHVGINPLGPGLDHFIGAKFDCISVTTGRRQRGGHGLGAVRADRVFRGPEVDGGQVLLSAVGQGHGGGCDLGEEDRGPAGSVFVRDRAALGGLERFRGVGQVYGGYGLVELDQGCCFGYGEVVPGDLGRSLGREPAVQVEFQDQVPAAVDRQVVPAVIPGLGPAEFRGGLLWLRLRRAADHRPGL